MGKNIIFQLIFILLMLIIISIVVKSFLHQYDELAYCETSDGIVNSDPMFWRENGVIVVIVNLVCCSSTSLKTQKFMQSCD